MDILVVVTLTVLVLMAVLIESLVEAVFGTLFDKFPALTPYKWTLMYIAFLVGIIGAFIYSFDLLHLLSTYLSNDVRDVIPITIFGKILTGLAIGRGSNYLHDLVTNWFKKAQAP